MHWVLPASRAVGEIPAFGGVDQRIGVRTERGVELIVDDPGPIFAAEFKVAGSDEFLCGDFVVGPKRRIGVDGAVIANRAADNLELNEPVWVFRADPLRLAAVGLFHDVLEIDLGTGRHFAEVDDDVGAFAWRKGDTGHGYCVRQQPAVVADLPHGGVIAQAQFIDPGQRAAEEAQAVFSALHVHEWLNRTVDTEQITDTSVVIERIPRNGAVEVEQLVSQGHWHVVWSVLAVRTVDGW